jgi:hypothetical protein
LNPIAAHFVGQRAKVPMQNSDVSVREPGQQRHDRDHYHQRQRRYFANRHKSPRTRPLRIVTVRDLLNSSRNYVSHVDPYRLTCGNNPIAHLFNVVLTGRDLKEFHDVAEGALHSGNLPLELAPLGRKFRL